MREIPPTAGLPLRWDDFLPRRGVSLEIGLSHFLQRDEVQIECSGTAALVVLLTALARTSTRRAVVIPAYTCPLVALAVAHCGLKPVLCDVREDRFDLCPHTLAQVCNEDTLAVIATHLGGRVADLDSAANAARAVGAAVIEDAAQSLGARWREQPVGSVGDAGFYSLAVGKGLTLYEGGVLVASEPRLRRLFKEIGREIAPIRTLWEIRRLLELAGYTTLYRPSALRWAYGRSLRSALRKGDLIKAVGDDFSPDIPLHKVSTWRKAIGARALERLPAFLAVLSAQALQRKARLEAITGITVIDDVEDSQGVWPYFMVLMPSEPARDAALSRLWTTGLGVSRLFIHALPDYPYLSSLLGDQKSSNARDFAARMLTVSNSPWLSEPEFLKVCDALETCTRASRPRGTAVGDSRADVASATAPTPARKSAAVDRDD